MHPLHGRGGPPGIDPAFRPAVGGHDLRGAAAQQGQGPQLGIQGDLVGAGHPVQLCLLEGVGVPAPGGIRGDLPVGGVLVIPGAAHHPKDAQGHPVIATADVAVGGQDQHTVAGIRLDGGQLGGRQGAGVDLDAALHGISQDVLHAHGLELDHGPLAAAEAHGVVGADRLRKLQTLPDDVGVGDVGSLPAGEAGPEIFIDAVRLEQRLDGIRDRQHGLTSLSARPWPPASAGCGPGPICPPNWTRPGRR